MEKMKVFKVGGNVLDDEKTLSSFLDDFSKVKGSKVLVHGGGKKATTLSQKLGIETKMVKGRRITDEATLEVVVMVYAGFINKKIVAGLQARNCDAVGLTGADGNAILAKKREVKEIDYGFAGDVEAVNADFLIDLMKIGKCPVLCSITHDAKGTLLNTNADTIANQIAIALAKNHSVELYYIFEKSGVLLNPKDESSVIPELTQSQYKKLVEQEIIHDGMIPKLDNAFNALVQGVNSVFIGSAEMLNNPNSLKTEISLS